MSSISFVHSFQLKKSPQYYCDEQIPIGITIIEGSTTGSIPVVIDGQNSKYSIVGTAIPEFCNPSTWSTSPDGKSLINSQYNITVYGSDVPSGFSDGSYGYKMTDGIIYITWHYNYPPHLIIGNNDPSISTSDPVIRIEKDTVLISIQTKDGLYEFPGRVLQTKDIHWNTEKRQLILTRNHGALDPIKYVFSEKSGQIIKNQIFKSLSINY